MSALRAMPTMLRIGVAETVAYRAEFLVWILTMTMPLVMLGLWTSVADEAPFASYGSADFVAYFLSTLIVRNLTSTWVGWQIAQEIRDGQMSMRLLRPIHPFYTLGSSHLAAVPFRSAVALPLAVVLLLSSGAGAMAHAPAQLVCAIPSVMIAWLITFAIQYAIGSVAFWLTDINAFTNIYYGVFALFSGYLLPLPLMPSFLAEVAKYTPFPSMLAAPVEIMTRDLTGAEIAELLATQCGWAAGMLMVALAVWRLGIRRFEAVGA